MDDIQQINKSATREKVKNFIIERFLLGVEDQKLMDDDSFFEKGIIDSTGILELVSFVEETFKIRVEDEELIPENLDSLSKINTFIEKKIESSGRG